jgi:hypothetical protein
MTIPEQIKQDQDEALLAVKRVAEQYEQIAPKEADDDE